MKKIEVLKEIWLFLVENKKWWLVPFFAVFLVIGILLLFVQPAVVAPFIYTLF